MPELIPPALRKQVGRPKKLRSRDPDELTHNQHSLRKGLTVTCNKCKQTGHNKRTCINKTSVLESSQKPSSTSTTSKEKSQQQAQNGKSQQHSKQATQLTPRRGLQTRVQHGTITLPPKRSARMQQPQPNQQAVKKLPIKSKAKGIQVGASKVDATSTFSV